MRIRSSEFEPLSKFHVDGNSKLEKYYQTHTSLHDLDQEVPRLCEKMCVQTMSISQRENCSGGINHFVY